MRKMTPEENQAVIDHLAWASICTVSPEGCPYAIEATPFRLEPDCIGFMINPRGTTQKNLLGRPDVLVKYTYASPDLTDWAGVSCFGTASFCEDQERIALGWKLLGEVLGTDYSKAAERFATGKMASPLCEIRVTEITGRCSARPKEIMPFPW